MNTNQKNQPTPSGISQAMPDTNPCSLNLQEQLFRSQELPTEIIVEPSRLAMGIFGDIEGDIAAAYSADVFPNVKAFAHQGQLYTNCGGTSEIANCYPLISAGCSNPTTKKPYSHEGEAVSYGKQTFTLGPKTKFASRPRTFQEEVSLLRRQYAYGGYFCAGKTYEEVLFGFLDHEGVSQNRIAAIESEFAREDLPQTQSEMRAQLGVSTDGKATKDTKSSVVQTTLPGMMPDDEQPITGGQSHE